MKNMNAETYLNVSVDHLFEQHSISEIEQVHKKLQNEIEQKKQEIRRFVGERYRDLIQAADSIGEMKTTSEGIVGHVNQISNSCKELNDQHLIGFKNEVSPEIRQERLMKAKFYGVVLQIKILTKIPELIEKSLEEEDFFIASQLCVLSRHIKTGLQVSETSAKFPVLDTIWDTLNPFFEIIKKRCAETLEREMLEPELAAKCLASVLLLDHSNFQRLISILIEARSKAFIKTLEEETYETAREKILASLRVLNQTVELLYSCFIENGGLLCEELNKISSEDSVPTLSYVFDYKDPKLKFLPEIVSKFKPQVNVSPLDMNELKKNLDNWLKFIKETTETNVSAIVTLITSIKTIQEVKRQTAKVSKPSPQIFKQLGLAENLVFYVSFYQRLVDLRLQQIIENAWKLATNETLDDTQNLLKSKKNESLKSWLWKEETSDNPQSLKFALEASSDQKKLLMKAYGFTPEIVTLCMKFDDKLEALVKDVKAYLTGEDSKLLRLKNDEMPDQIGAFLNNCSRDNVNNLITQIKQFKLDEKPENYITIARILQAIPQLCPNLRSCLSTLTLLESSSDLYTKSSQLLNEEAIHFWMIWLNSFCQVLDAKLTATNIDFNTILKEFPMWEIVKIQEKDEQDNEVDSTIRVPSKPSFPLQRFLHETCTALNEVIPHTLPKTISTHLVERISRSLYIYYKNLSQIQFVTENQNTSLQYYFDLKFVNYLIVPKDNKNLLEDYQNLIQEYKSFIDPFDFDVFYPYVNENVKKSAQRMQYQISCLASNQELMTTNVSQKQDSSPNVLTLSSNATTITWFPLLPISDTSGEGAGSSLTGITGSSSKLSTLIDSEKQSLNKVTAAASNQMTLDKTLRTAQNYADNVKSGAAAFFGDWFKS